MGAAQSKGTHHRVQMVCEEALYPLLLLTKEQHHRICQNTLDSERSPPDVVGLALVVVQTRRGKAEHLLTRPHPA